MVSWPRSCASAAYLPECNAHSKHTAFRTFNVECGSPVCCYIGQKNCCMQCGCQQRSCQSLHKDRHESFCDLLNSARVNMPTCCTCENDKCNCSIVLGLHRLRGTTSHLESPLELFRHLRGPLRGAGRCCRGCRGREGCSSASCNPLRLPLCLTLCVLPLQALQLSLCISI